MNNYLMLISFAGRLIVKLCKHETQKLSDLESRNFLFKKFFFVL